MSNANGDTVVPLVSSGTAGPLGLLHLPRLWTKLRLQAAGRLPEGYDSCGQGFDQMTLDALGLNRADVIAFVSSAKPTYVQFEEWIVQKRGKPDPDLVKKHNAAIAGYNHAPELADTMRKASGISDASINDAVSLNSVDDLDALHHSLA